MNPVRLLLAAVVAVILVSCTVQGGGPATSEPVGKATESPSSRLRVGLTEWSIHTGAAVAAPGELAMVVTNAGGTAHDLVVDGELGSWRTPLIDPGDQFTLTVDTAPGETLLLVCSVPGHHESGMHTTLEVAGASGGDP